MVRLDPDVMVIFQVRDVQLLIRGDVAARGEVV